MRSCTILPRLREHEVPGVNAMRFLLGVIVVAGLLVPSVMAAGGGTDADKADRLAERSSKTASKAWAAMVPNQEDSAPVGYGATPEDAERSAINKCRERSETCGDVATKTDKLNNIFVTMCCKEGTKDECDVAVAPSVQAAYNVLTEKLKKAGYSNPKSQCEAGSPVTAGTGRVRWAAMSAHDQHTLKVVWRETENGAIERANDDCSDLEFGDAGGYCTHKGASVKIEDNNPSNDLFVTACCTTPLKKCAVAAGESEKALKKLKYIFEDNGLSDCKVRDVLSADSGKAVEIAPDLKAILAGAPARSHSLQHQWHILTDAVLNGPDNIAYTRDGSNILFMGGLSGNEYNNLIEFDVETKKARQVFDENFIASAMEIKPELDLAAQLDPYGKVEIRSIESGAVKRVINVGDQVGALAIAPDGKLLASASEDDKEVTIWDVATGERLRTLPADKYEMRLIVFSPTGEHVAALGKGGSPKLAIFVWDVVTGELAAKLEHSALHTFAYSPDGRMLAATRIIGSSDVVIWDTVSGEMIREITTPEFKWTGPFYKRLAFSPDGKFIAAAGKDGAVDLIDVSTGKVVARYESSRDFLTAESTIDFIGVAFAPDGKLIALLRAGERALELFDASAGSRTFAADPTQPARADCLQLGGTYAGTCNRETLAFGAEKADLTISIKQIACREFLVRLNDKRDYNYAVAGTLETEPTYISYRKATFDSAKGILGLHETFMGKDGITVESRVGNVKTTGDSAISFDSERFNLRKGKKFEAISCPSLAKQFQ